MNEKELLQSGFKKSSIKPWGNVIGTYFFLWDDPKPRPTRKINVGKRFYIYLYEDGTVHLNKNGTYLPISTIQKLNKIMLLLIGVAIDQKDKTTQSQDSAQ